MIASEVGIDAACPLAVRAAARTEADADKTSRIVFISPLHIEYEAMLGADLESQVTLELYQRLSRRVALRLGRDIDVQSIGELIIEPADDVGGRRLPPIDRVTPFGPGWGDLLPRVAIARMIFLDVRFDRIVGELKSSLWVHGSLSLSEGMLTWNNERPRDGRHAGRLAFRPLRTHLGPAALTFRASPINHRTHPE